MVPARFVGRAAELAALRRVLGAGAGGGLVVLVGEAGMGKSQLVNALSADLVGVARVPAPPAQQEPVWRSWTVDLRRSGATAGDAPAAAVSPEERADALVSQWATIAVPRRPALVLEDAHWADAETLRLLDRLAGPGVSRGLRLLVTTRPHGDAARRLLATARSVGGLVLELAPWQEDEAIRYAREVLEVAELDPAVAERIHGAHGWPLLVDELVASWRRGLTSAATSSHRLEELVAERLAALPPPAREVVLRAALLGADPDTEVLAASYPDPGVVASALRDAVGTGLLVKQAESGRVAFRHDLVRDAVVADAVDLERRAQATALLRVLEDPAAWAWRWRQVAALAVLADRVDLAVAVSLAGAASTLGAGSPLLAAGLADDAAALAHGPAKVRALGLSVRALALAGDVTAALEAGQRFDAAQSVDPDPELWTSVQEAKARALGMTGRWREALELLGGATASPVQALALLETGEFEAALEVAEAVLAATGDPAMRCEAMEVAGRVARRNDLDSAERWFARAAAQAESARLPLWRARALHELATIAQVRRLEVDPLYRAREAAVAAGAVGLATSVDFHIAAVHGVRFEPEPALVAARRLLSDARRLGLASQEAWAWVLIGQAHAVAGDRLRAEQAGGDAAALAGDDLELQAMALGIGALAALVDDDDTARSRWREAVDRLRRTPSVSPLPPWYLWPVLATVHDLEGDGGARARAEVGDSDLATFAGVAGLCRIAEAIALGRAGDRLGAHAAWRQGLGLVERMPDFVGWLHLAHCLAARAAYADGWGEPVSWLADAEGWYARRRLTRLVSRCRVLARELGVPQRRRGRGLAEVPPHLEALGVTSREMDVLLLVCAGLTNAQVAERLVLSPGTVKGYVERLLAKTGAPSRAGLCASLTEP